MLSTVCLALVALEVYSVADQSGRVGQADVSEPGIEKPLGESDYLFASYRDHGAALAVGSTGTISAALTPFGTTRTIVRGGPTMAL